MFHVKKTVMGFIGDENDANEENKGIVNHENDRNQTTTTMKGKGRYC